MDTSPPLGLNGTTSSSSTTTTRTANANPDFYAGYTRFEIELEFVQTLSNPLYLQYLASQKLLDDPPFVAYLSYLQYFRQPEYLRYLQYPGPTLRALELLQEPRFRQDILVPAIVDAMVKEGFEAATAGIQQRR